MASFPKRTSRGLATEVLFTRGEEEPLRGSSTVPPEQQRLVFTLSTPLVLSCSGQDPLVTELQTAQAVLFQDSRAVGRLVKPRVLVDSPGELSPVSRVSLIFDYWQPTFDRKLGPEEHLRIPLDSRYHSTSAFSICAILTGKQGGAIALPGRHEWSGSKTAAAVSQHQQRIHYIRTQQRRYTEGEGKDSPNRHPLARSDAEFTIETGPEWEASSLSLTFNTAAELAWLQRVILKLLVIPKAPVDDSGGPVDNTSAEVTVSSSSGAVPAPGAVAMASASTQPVPQAHGGQQQQAGGGAKQVAHEQVQHDQQQGPVSTSGQVVGAMQAADAEQSAHPGGPFAAAGTDAPAASSSASLVVETSGGAAGSYRSGAKPSSRSGSNGAGGDSGASSDSEGDVSGHGQQGGGRGRGPVGSRDGGGGNDGDGEDPRRDQGHVSQGSASKPGRKQKDKRESDAGAEEVSSGSEQQPLAEVASSCLSDRDCAASPQDSTESASTVTTGASAESVCEQPSQRQQLSHGGVAESKPTVKLIPRQAVAAAAAERTTTGAAESSAPSVDAAAELAPCGKRSCCGGAGSPAHPADSCRTPGAHDGNGEAGAADVQGSTEAALATADAGSRQGKAEAPVTGRTEEQGGSRAAGAKARSESTTPQTEPPPLPLPPPEQQQQQQQRTAEPSAEVAALHPPEASQQQSHLGTGHKARETPAGPGPAANTPGAAVPPAQQPATAAHSPPPPAPRSHANGPTWSQSSPSSHAPGLKGALQGSPQEPGSQQQHHSHAQQTGAVSAGGAPMHMPHLPVHGAHSAPHPMPNGKVRNGELSDPAVLAQQLLPFLGLTPGQAPSSASPPLPSMQLHNGLEAALLMFMQQQHNGSLQQHQQQQQHAAAQAQLQAAQMGGAYAWQQAAQQHQHQQQHPQFASAVHPHQHPAVLHQAVQQHLFQQHLLHQSVQQQHQQQQQAPQQHQQQQQHLLHGLAQVRLGPQAEPGAANPGTGVGAEGVASAATVQHPSGSSAPAPAAATGDAVAAQSPAPEADAQGAQAALPSPLVPPLPLPPLPTPILAPTPTVPSSALGEPSAAQSSAAWDTSSTGSVRSEPSTAVSQHMLDRPLGYQHRVQSQGNMLASMQSGAGSGGGGGGVVGGGQAAASRDGGGGPRSSSLHRGRSSLNGAGGGGGSGSASAGPSGAVSSAPQAPGSVGGGGGAYAGRQYGHPGGGGGGGGQRHGGSSHGYVRGGGRFDGGSAESSRPSSRGPHPHGGGFGRHPHTADPIPPPDALPLPDPKGSCDLDRFISQIEPVIHIDPAKPPQQALKELCLRDLWNFYFEPSLYGREVFTLGGHRGASNSYFVPYLSAIQIFTRALPTDVGGTNRLYVSEDNHGWPKHMHLKFEYFEQELPFNRLPLYDQIELLSAVTVGAGKAAGGAPTVTPPAGPSTGAAPPKQSAVPPAAAAAAPPAAASESLVGADTGGPAAAETSAQRPTVSSGAEAAMAPAPAAHQEVASDAAAAAPAAADGSPSEPPAAATPQGEKSAEEPKPSQGEEGTQTGDVQGAKAEGAGADACKVPEAAVPQEVADGAKDGKATAVQAKETEDDAPATASSTGEGQAEPAAAAPEAGNGAAPTGADTADATAAAASAAQAEDAQGTAAADAPARSNASSAATSARTSGTGAAEPAGGAAASATASGGGNATGAASAAPPPPAAPFAATTATPTSATAPSSNPSSIGPGSRLLYDMRLFDVHPASWFAVAWYPVYRIPDAPLYARFLTFHSFAPLVESMRNAYERLLMGQVVPYCLLSLPVVGLNWYNMQGERWMEPLDESAVAGGGAGLHQSLAMGGHPQVASSAPGGPSTQSPRVPHRHQRGGNTDVWYQHLLQSYQSTADRLARGAGLRVLGQHGAEEVRLRVPDYEFFRARS